VHKKLSGSDSWCSATCATSVCPKDLCVCGEEAEGFVKPGKDTEEIVAQEVAKSSQPQAFASPAPFAAAAAAAAKSGQPLANDWAVGVPLPEINTPEWIGDNRNFGRGNVSCVSIDAATSSSWCQSQCVILPGLTNAAYEAACPSTVCKCDAQAAQQAAAATESALDEWKDAEERVRSADPDTAYPDGFPALPEGASPVPLPQLPKVAKRVPASRDTSTCKAVAAPATDRWCRDQCATEECPQRLCKCADNAGQPAAQEVLENWRKGFEHVGASPIPAPEVAKPVERKAKSKDPTTCKSISAPATDKWCVQTCATENCPTKLCLCDDYGPSDQASQASPLPAVAMPEPAARTGVKSKKPETCKATTNEASDAWCAQTCATEHCPTNLCLCDDYGPAQAAEVATASPNPLLPVPLPKVGKSKKPETCKAISDSATDAWCASTCGSDDCPTKLCLCDDYGPEDQKLPGLPDSVVRAGKSSKPETCKAISDPATDSWCASTCATEECPTTLCKCEDYDAAQQAAELEAIKNDRAAAKALVHEDQGLQELPKPKPTDNLGLADSTCVSLSTSTNDYWCATTCATSHSPDVCPPSICKCGEPAEASERQIIAESPEQLKVVPQPPLPVNCCCTEQCKAAGAEGEGCQCPRK
jgi:hypothetical protein